MIAVEKWELLFDRETNAEMLRLHRGREKPEVIGAYSMKRYVDRLVLLGLLPEQQNET